MTTLVETVGNVESSDASNPKWEEDSQNMKKSRTWLTQQACLRIEEMCKLNVKKSQDEFGELPDEIEFHYFNVRNDLMKFCGYNNYEPDKKYDGLPMEYSFDTIFNGGFTSPSGRVNRNRLKQAGVVNPFVLDVKRAMADKCVKVWDVSDKKVSKKIVWKITIFINEIKKKEMEKQKSEQPEE